MVIDMVQIQGWVEVGWGGVGVGGWGLGGGGGPIITVHTNITASWGILQAIAVGQNIVITQYNIDNVIAHANCMAQVVWYTFHNSLSIYVYVCTS